MPLPPISAGIHGKSASIPFVTAKANGNGVRYKVAIRPEPVLEESLIGELHSATSLTSEILRSMIAEEYWRWRIKDLRRMGMSDSEEESITPINIFVCRSQFFITFKPAPHLDRKHTVFGKLVGGEEVLNALENVGVKPGTERPAKPIRITEVEMYV